jgi:hypothetical protein
MLNIVNIFDEPEPTNDRPGTARLDDVPSNVAITAHDRVHDRRKRDTEGAQAVWIHINLILSDSPSDTGHLGDARHGIELIADVPVLERAQVPECVARPFHGIPEDMSYPCGVRAEGWHDA